MTEVKFFLDRLQGYEEERGSKRARVERAEEGGWECMDRNSEYFEIKTCNRPFPTLNLLRTSSTLDVFLRLFPVNFIMELVARCTTANPQVFTYPNGRSMSMMPSSVLKGIAVYIRIQVSAGPVQNWSSQGIYRKSNPGDRVHNPARGAIQEARTHFNKYDDVPGITWLEKFLSNFQIDYGSLEDFSLNLQSVFLQLGHAAAGDEKLFKFTGKSAFSRLVPNKPDKVGLWFYELAVQVCI
jgi:hypothetical protein